MAYSHILVGASTSPRSLVVRRITPSDLFHALARGVDDFIAMPSHAIFLCVIYPLLGIFLIGVTLGDTCCRWRFRSPRALRWSDRSPRSVFTN